MLIIIIIVSLLFAALIAGAVRKRIVVEAASVCASLVALISASLMALKTNISGSFESAGGVFTVDALGAFITLIVAVVGFFAMIYAVPYFRKESTKQIIGSWRVRQYYVLTNLFLAAMFLAATASNPVVAWIFLEATTLTTVFLISYYNRRSTIEAAWKYLIINAVGLLLAFLGTILYFTATGSGENLVSWQDLIANAGALDPAIAKIAFAFVVIGYGVKIGFAPMHTWKPDAYSKSPAPLAALFSGALMPVAFALLLKFKIITDAAIGADYSSSILIIFGMLSLLIAAFSALISHNYKRLLAYSSVEHAGIMALGFGFGGIGIAAALMHMLYHSLIKPALFFLTGNVLVKYHTARIAKVAGMISVIPATAALLFIGLFAITGFPPFGMFLTEMSIISTGLGQRPAIAVAALLAIALIFVGLFRQINKMVLSQKPEGADIKPGEDSRWLLIAPVTMLALALIASFYLPPFLQQIINQIAEVL